MAHKVSPNHIVLAARQGDLTSVKQLVRADAAAAGKADDSGETALQCAAHQGNWEMCEVLLLAGGAAALDVGTPVEGLTPLALAVSRGHSDVVQLLLDYKASVHSRDARHCTPLHHAAYKGHGSLASLLIRAGAEGTPAIPEGCDDPPESPLTIAAFMRHAQVAIALMTEGGVQPSTIESPQDRAWAEQLLKAHQEQQRLEEERRAQQEQQGLGSPSSRSGRLGSSSEPLRPSSSRLLRAPQRPRPLTPVYVPPTPHQLDEGEALMYAAADGSPSGRHPGEPAVWFQIHEESIEVIPVDDQDDLDYGNTDKQPLYRVPAGTQSSASLPALTPTSGTKPGAGSSGAAGRGYSSRDAKGRLGAKAASADRILHLYPISYLDIAQGFLLDEDQRFVYYLDPLLQKWVLDAQQQSQPRMRPFPFAPHFVGRWESAPHGSSGAAGFIKPVVDEWHCVLLENYGAPARRCLRQNSPAAAWLSNRSGIAAEFAASGQDPRDVPLVVPLCAILGVQEMSEVASLTEADLQACFTDTQLIEPLLRSLQSLGMAAAPARPQTATSRPATSSPSSPSGTSRPGTATARATSAVATRRPMTARPSTASNRTRSAGGGSGGGGSSAFDTQQPAPDQLLVSLLQEHALMKLLPLAAELRIVEEVSRWHHLATAAPVWCELGLSRFEQVRLANLLQAISAVQEARVQRRLTSLTQLVRVSVGAICLYEAGCRQNAQPVRGQRLLGLVIEDVNNGSKFKVRDLLDDELVWAAPGQLTRVSPGEAMNYLRADLLPPPTFGPPVIPATAFVGAPVQLAYHFWARPTPAAGDAADRDGATLQAGLDVQSAKSVVGIMVEAANSDGTAWRVRWPDGSVCLHATGSDGRFELAHFQLHRAAGAPLSRTHIEGLLLGQDVGTLAVVRSPLWSRPSTDDDVPGSVGLALLEAGQTALTVVWGCSTAPRDHPPMYSPDGQGMYQLCHALMPGQLLNMWTAKEGVPVVDERGRHGELVSPVALVNDAPGVVWGVAWAGGSSGRYTLNDHALVNDADDSSPGLRVSDTFHVEKQLDRIKLLNEVHIKHAPGCQQTGGCCGARRQNCSLGRAAFWKGPTAHVVGAMAPADQPLLLGQLVKLNKAVIDLQPGAESGPMACFDHIDIPTLMRARREGEMLDPLPRDDIGVVVRDLGPGTWRGVMVRKYGATKAAWYDETVLLPACQQDVNRQGARQKSGNYAMPRTLQGVPVIDGNAAPGMLVQRAFREGAFMQNSDKATIFGVLVSQPQPLVWTVRWADGKVRDYRTGYRGQFQLCYAQSCLATGAPLMHSTVQEMAAQNNRVAVTDGMFCMNSPCAPGTVRWVNDKDTQLGLPSGEARLLEAASMVVTTTGERLFAGGPLQLYELSHAVVPGAPLTVYIAKKGLRVELHTEGVEEEETGAAKEADESTAHGKRKAGVLLAPIRLVTTSLRKAANAKQTDEQAPEPVNVSAITGNFRTPNGRIISSQELCASADRTPVWLRGNYKTTTGRFMTAGEMCASLERLHNANRNEQQGGNDAAAAKKDQDLNALIQEMYLSKVISEDDEGRLVRVERVIMGDKELWVPIGQPNTGAEGTAATSAVTVAEDHASGGAAPLPRVMVDSAKLVWQVMWDDGSSGEFVVGTEASHSCLRVAGSIEGLDPPAAQLFEPEHFVRMLEPVLLIDTGSRIRNRHLARLADALQSALQWHNQLLRELVNVWWSSSPLMTSEAVFRPQVELLQRQPDSVTLFVKGRASRMAVWEVVDHDEDGQVIERIDARADADLAQAIAALVRALGSRPMDGQGSAAGPAVLHLLPSEASLALLDEAGMSDGSGRTVEAPEELALLLANVNDAVARLRQGFAAAEADDDRIIQLDVDCSIEPSMGVPQQALAAIGAAGPAAAAGAAAGGVSAGSGSADDAMVVRVTTSDGEVLMPTTGRTMSRRSQEAEAGQEAPSGSSLMLTIVRQPMSDQQEQPQLSDIMPVGPGMMLTMGCAARLRRGLQGIQRCLGALAGSALPVTSTQGAWGGHGRRGLLLVGSAPVLWLEVVELETITGCLPRDLPLARCRAAVNIHLFDMWKVCARDFIPGAGSADISRCLFRLLQVVQQKAEAAVAADTAVRWADASIQAGTTCHQKMDALHRFYAGDVKTFASSTARAMMHDVRQALATLTFVHEAAQTAHDCACRAVVSSQLMIEQDDVDALQGARERTAAAIDACASNTRNAFPNMADAAVVAAEHVVQDMHTMLKRCDQELAHALADRKAAAEGVAACEKEAKEALSAAESVKAKYDAIASKLKDLHLAHNQLKAEEESAAAAAASVERLQVAWREKQEWCTLKGQAKLLRTRLELMLEARASSDKLSQQLRDLAQGGEGAASTEALATLAHRVEELLRWAADCEQSGFSLTAELKRALGVVKSKVEVVLATLHKLVGESGKPSTSGDDAETLELLAAVAHLGVEAADRAGEVAVKEANESVLLAIEKAMGGTPAAGGSGQLAASKGILADLEPALEATAHFSSCLQATITMWAAFSMQLAREAARDTSLSEVTTRLSEQVAADVARQRHQSQAGADMVQRQAMEQQGTELSVAVVLATADREEKAAKKRLEEAEAAAQSGQENVQRISAVLDKLLHEISAAVHEAQQADEAVAGRQGAALEQVQRAVELVVKAETAVWRARRAAPASAHPDFKLPPGEPKDATHVGRAQAAVQACAEALEVLALMRRSIPPVLRSPEAADRMLATCQARVAAAAARAAAEWGRTAALCCDSQLADQEWYERVAACLSAAEKRESKDHAQLVKLDEAKADAKAQIQAQLQALLSVYQSAGGSKQTLPEALQSVDVLVNGKHETKPVLEPEAEVPVQLTQATGDVSDSRSAWVLEPMEVNGQTVYLDQQSRMVYLVGGNLPTVVGSWDGVNLVPLRPSAIGGVFQKLDEYLKVNRVRFREMFDEFDVDRKGHLSFQELRLLLNSLQPELSEADLQYFEAMMDTNQDSQLTVQEFLEMARMALESLQQGRATRAQEVVAAAGAFLRKEKDAVADIFNSLDADEDGLLFPREVVLLFKHAMPGMHPADLRYILARLNEVDQHHHGVIGLKGLMVALGAMDAQVAPLAQPPPQQAAAEQPSEEPAVVPKIEEQSPSQAAAQANPQQTKVDFDDAVQAYQLGQNYTAIVEALCQLDVPQAVSMQHMLPAPRPLRGQALDDVCAAASRHLPVAVRTYFDVRPQVDPAVDLGIEDTVVVRVLQSVFTTLDQVSKQSTEAAEQLASGQQPSTQQGSSAKTAQAAGASAKVEGSVRMTEGSESGKVESKRDPLAAPQATMLHCGEVVQAAESLTALAGVCQAAAQLLHPDLAQKLENVARPAKAATNAAKRSQIAVSRSLAEAVKQVGPPAFVSGVLASVQSKLAMAESDQAKALKWTQQAADTFETKVKPEMEAALAATEPPPPKSRPEDEEGEAAGLDHAAEAAEQHKLAEKTKLHRLEQQEKERAIGAFVARIAVDVADAACDAGDKLDLSSYMAPNDDEMTEAYTSAADLTAAAEFLAADDISVQAASLPAATRAALEGVDETLVKLCRALRAVVVANDVLRLAGSHPDVKRVEAGLDDVLKSCTNVPKMQGALLEKYASACDESVRDRYDSIGEAEHLQLRKLVAYEQVVIAAIAMCERILDAAKLINVSQTTEDNLVAARSDLTASQAKLARLMALPGAPVPGQDAGQQATAEQGGHTGELTVKLHVLLSGAQPATAMQQGEPSATASQASQASGKASSGGAPPHPWELLVGFAPPAEEPMPLAEYVQQQDPGQPAPAELIATSLQLAEVSRGVLAEQQKVVQGDCAAELTDRISPVQKVLARPAVAKYLQPFVTLMDACNRALAAVAVAEPSRPDDGLLLSHALLGAPDISHQAAANNFNQFRRWDHEVAIMQASARLVLFGFVKAQAMAATELPEIVLQPLPKAPPPPVCEYQLG